MLKNLVGGFVSVSGQMQSEKATQVKAAGRRAARDLNLGSIPKM